MVDAVADWLMGNPGVVGRAAGDALYGVAKTTAKQYAANFVGQKASKTLGGSQKRPRASSKKSASVRLVPSGGGFGTRTVVKPKGASKKKQESIKKRVARLEKKMPTVSNYEHNRILHAVLKYGSINQSKCVYFLLVKDHLYFEALLNDIDRALLTENTSTKIQQNWIDMELRANFTGNCQLRYKFICPKQYTSVRPEDDLLEYYADHGMNTPTKAAPVATSTLNAYQPAKICYEADERYYPISGMAEWKSLTNFSKFVKLGPGDSLNIFHKFKDLNYKPEIQDKTGYSYNRDQDVMICIEVRNAMLHAGASAHTGVIGYGLHQIDMIMRDHSVAKIQDGKGLRDTRTSIDADFTNFSAPEHADNFASSMETDAVT